MRAFLKAAPVLTRALVFGAVLIVAVAVVGSVVGYLVDGMPGLLSALVGAGVTAMFMGFTTLSIVLADRATRSTPSTGRYFGIIIGMWLAKFVLFIVILVVVSGQGWLSPYVFFFTLLTAVIGTLVVDAVAMQGARVSYVRDVELPGSTEAERAVK